MVLLQVGQGLLDGEEDVLQRLHLPMCSRMPVTGVTPEWAYLLQARKFVEAEGGEVCKVRKLRVWLCEGPVQEVL